MKHFILIAFLCCVAGVAIAQIKIIDGDSLEIGERRIRLDGIDAPELLQLCFNDIDEEYPCGKQALEFTANFISGTEPDCRCLPEKDKYGRELCECFVNDVSLNEALVSAGWAMSYRDTKYDKAQNAAEGAKRGIWQGKFMRPALFRVLERYTTEQK